MTPTDLVQLIGLLHLAQPPVTVLLARRLDLLHDVYARTPIGGSVLHNMGVAAVALPTSLGLVLALHPEEALVRGAGGTLAHLLGVFWCWRLFRQIRHLNPIWPHTPASTARIRHLLSALFLVKGPLLLALLQLDEASAP